MVVPSQNLLIQVAYCYKLTLGTEEVQNWKCFQCLREHSPAHYNNKQKLLTLNYKIKTPKAAKSFQYILTNGKLSVCLENS